MIKIRELYVGSSFLVAGNAIQAVVAFAVNLVLVRYISPEDFGRFAVIMASAALVYSVLSLRIETMIIRARSDQLTEDARDRYFGASVIETLFATLVILIWIFMSDSQDGWQVGVILALGLRHWMQQSKAMFERTMPYRKLAIAETSVATASHLIALALVLNGMGWPALFLREIFLSVAGFLALWAIGGLTFRRIKIPRPSDWRKLLSEARGIWLDAALENGLARLTILFVGILGGDRAAGFFYQALRLASLPTMVLAPIVSRVAATWFGQTEDREARRAGRNRLLRALLGPVIIAAVLTVLFAEPVVPWLLGEPWARAGELMVGLAGFVLFGALFEVLKSYCWVARQVRWLLVGRIFQYVGCAIPVAGALTGYLSGDMALAVGQSLAYGMAFLIVMALLKNMEKY